MADPQLFLLSQQPIRVAAYCRVSTDKEDQLNSLATQRQFFASYLGQRPAWRCVGIYADEGLSGTCAGSRPQFSRLIRQAMAGEVDLILTKEVSRFARNTVDALQITRRLKEAGVGVFFLNDNICTLDNDGEFRLTIMASVAQEESRKISERTRWGQLQAMRRGVVFGNDSIYGYRLLDGVLTPQPGQAQVIRRVYRAFLQEGKGTHTIARELTEAGVPPPLRPQGRWSPAMVLRLLRNEKYTGDLLQKKYRTTDYLTHRKIPNDRPEEQFWLRDHHPAIVSRRDFEAVQQELARRSALSMEHRRHSARHWYSGKLRCGLCGKSLSAKRTRRKNGGSYLRFVCRGRLDGSGCTLPPVSGPVLLAAVAAAVDRLALNGAAIQAQVLAQLPVQPAHAERERLRDCLQAGRLRRDRAVEAFLDGALSRAELNRLTARWEEEQTKLTARLEQLEECPDRSAQNQALLAQVLEDEALLLDEIIQQITVGTDSFLIQPAELPLQFEVRAQGTGTGRNYRTQVLSCDVRPLPPSL